jgi:uncharacterized protein
MEDSSNICLSCGICCTGTLIGFVQLEGEEKSELKELLDIEGEIGNGFFLQPCVKYCDGCTIYSQRPTQCRAFKCGLLKSVERNELEFDSAVDIINVVKQKRIEIEKMIAFQQLELKSPSFYFKMVELKKLLLKYQLESTLTPNHQELTGKIDQLESLLLDKFGISLN